jgi:hypothetical protein
LLRAQIAFAVNRGRDHPPLLLRAARRLEPLDAGLARETYLEALSAAMQAGRLASGGNDREVAEAARAAPPPARAARGSDLLLEGLAVLFTDGDAAGIPILKRALRAFCGDEFSSGEGARWLSLACRVAIMLWDDESWHALAARDVQLARDTAR